MPLSGDDVVSLLNQTSLAASLAVAYQLNILETCLGFEGKWVSAQSGAISLVVPEPFSLEDFVHKSGLDERYLKELFAILVSGSVLEYDGDGELYWLDESTAHVLTTKGGTDNMLHYCAEIPLLAAAALPRLAQCFRSGQGLDYQPYVDLGFAKLMADMSAAKHRRVLIDDFIKQGNPDMAERLLDGIRVLDVGCGTGAAVVTMAAAYPKSTIYGIDLDGDALAQGRAEAEQRGLSNAHFIQHDASQLHACTALQSQSMDWILAFDAIHDQTQPEACLNGIVSLLKLDGCFSMVDIKASCHLKDNLSHPFAPFLYTVSLLHCLPIGKKDNGAGLGMMWGEQRARDLLSAAGFGKIQVLSPPKDGFNSEYRCWLQ
eukprot:TRINITY_DN12226_c0_g2_i6.p1 TRINITY_DN12226_c0_g2~~TRINITY_DN12226_c0_g2_i6.p1  ORF type:complete len:374 (+),score=57.42 TRINITY_DN12226_c0_g2_i6:25-1146(+)